jgi:hypothetical protein
MVLKFYWRMRDAKRRIWPRVTSPIRFLGRWRSINMRRNHYASRVRGNVYYMQAVYDDQSRPYSGRSQGYAFASKCFVRKWPERGIFRR